MGMYMCSILMCSYEIFNSVFIYFPYYNAQRRQWQPTPVLLPGKSHGQWSLVGCRLWGGTESDTTEATQQQYTTMLQCKFLKEGVVSDTYVRNLLENWLMQL